MTARPPLAPPEAATWSDIDDDEQQTMVRLLQSIPTEIASFELRKHDFRAAGTKLACAALASQAPYNLHTRQPVDVAALLDEHGASAFHALIPPQSPDPRTRGTENRLLHPITSRKLRGLLMSAPDRLLSGHCVPLEARDALLQGKDAEFLVIRHRAIEELVRTFLEQRARVPSD